MRNNQIEDIGEIRQFPHLTKLKLDNNRIVEVSFFIDALKGLKELREVSIKGNPMLNQIFNCKTKIILGLRQISTLDSSRVNEEARAKALLNIEQEEELWKTLIKEVANLKALKVILKRGKYNHWLRDAISMEELIEAEKQKLIFSAELYRKSKEQKLAKKYA
eukprot:TRINITY_DN18825_c0_g1_i2.p1 TRINITY_DN18825_c0_g1~~TRINITY_DN18825_c0_g1_i2.p1  ORF type:complete len:163 (-),score=30.60 TRINITY_DN18825_c0_g1_i2:482-970(-)